MLLTTLAGCTRTTQQVGPAVQSPAKAAAVHRIVGRLAYRERIALPPSARVEVVVTDITPGANQELVLARAVRTVENASPPIPFAPIAGTLRACAPGLMEQERHFMAQFGKVTSVRLDQAGRPVLRAGDGTEMVARRERPER